MKLKMNKERTYKTPIDDLRLDNLKHYEEASESIHHWSSGLPRAINFYYDYCKMSRWERFKLSFKIQSKQR